jgi:predicted transcriptional regulator
MNRRGDISIRSISAFGPASASRQKIKILQRARDFIRGINSGAKFPPTIDEPRNIAYAGRCEVDRVRTTVTTSNPIDLAAEIVTSFVSNNSVPRAELPALIEAVHAAVKRLADGGEVAPAAIDPPAPAVSIRKSVTPDYLICLDDGRRFKTLRGHLATLGMTPEQYRAK